MHVQLELDANETLAKHWKRLAKKEAAAAAAAAKEAGEGQSAHVPVAQRPEACFLPSLLTEFLEVRLCPSHHSVSVLACNSSPGQGSS